MKEETVNIKILKQYSSDEEEDPQQVASQATQRFDVERIISHSHG